MITYFLTPGIRGSVIKQCLANNVWLKVPAKVCVLLFMCVQLRFILQSARSYTQFHFGTFSRDH